jgi:transposase
MAHMKKQYEAAFKARVALEAVKGENTIAQIASESGVPPNKTWQWWQHLLDALPEAFSNRRPQEEKARDDVEAELYWQIGQLKVDLDWLKNISQSLMSK